MPQTILNCIHYRSTFQPPNYDSKSPISTTISCGVFTVFPLYLVKIFINITMDNTISHSSNTTSILSEVQRIHNTSVGYEVRTTTHTDTSDRVESSTTVYTVYDRSLRIQDDPYARSGTVLDILV